MPLILHINNSLSSIGGVEVYIGQLLELQHANGHESHWLAVSLSGRDISIKSNEAEWCWNGRLNNLGMSPLGEACQRGSVVFHVHSLSEPKFLDLLFEMGPVVRHMHEPRMFCPGHGKFWARGEDACKRPFGLHCLAHAYLKGCCNRHPKRLLPAFTNCLYERRAAGEGCYSQILANSNWMREEAIAAGFPAEAIRVLYCPTPEAVEQGYAEARTPRIVFAGRLARTKGVHYLLRAFAHTKDFVPGVQLDILGAGIDEAEFQRLAYELGLASSVKFHGWADRQMINTFMRQASLVAFPSIYPEAFGISGIEAMMRGKPVVGFDVGGVKDWLRHDETGLLVPAKDTQGFADAMVLLLRNDALREAMGIRARELALSEFSESIHLEKLIKVYEAALGVA